MIPKGVSLRGLEVFEAIAQAGSVAGAARATGLSLPAVSQQMKNLETALGVDLVDHGRRPMRLTPAGRSFLNRTESILHELRVAHSELTVMDLSHLSELSIGVIDDFDNDLTPQLVTTLAENLINCRFRMMSASSTDLLDALKQSDLHMAISAHTGEVMDDLTEYPLLDDPFLLVAPKGFDLSDPQATLRQAPFLRYSSDQLIARQIEAQFRRHKIAFDNRFEVASHMALMAMIAGRIGWTITTALGYMRARRFHDQIEAHPLPIGSEFARRISLFAGANWADDVPRDIAATFQRLAHGQIMEPAIQMQPWLGGGLRLLA